MASDEPGPGQQHALQARKLIAALPRARPGIVIEIRWCPAHEGIAGNEKADEWAKTAAEEPCARGGMVELLGPELVRCNSQGLAHLKREISEKKLVAKYRMPKRWRPDATAAGSTKCLPRGSTR